MKFVQVVIAENEGVASGANLRDSANLEALSMIGAAAQGGRVVSLRADKRRGQKTASPILAPLLASDVAQLVTECRNDRPDFVLFEGIQHFHAIRALSGALPDLPVILDMHNIESALRACNDRLALLRPLQPLAPLIFGRRQALGLQAERQAIGMARQIWVCSNEDRRAAQAYFGDCPTAVVPNRIPSWTSGFELRRRTPSDEVLFVGHLGYAPNRRAVELLCREIMPRLRRLVPRARLHVCGRRPRRGLQALLAAQGHRLSANAEDLAPVYAGAAVTAMPLTEGGGTRLKVLEALAVGCPIVATAKAVEGLGLEPWAHYHPAESAEDFARAISEVLASQDMAARLSDRGRRFVLQHYGQKAHLAAIRQALSLAGLSPEGRVQG